MKTGYLKKDSQERFNMKRSWRVNAWRIVDAEGNDMVQPWSRTKTEARNTAKHLNINLIEENAMETGQPHNPRFRISKIEDEEEEYQGPESNVDFITRVMTYNKCGALMQGFIIEALFKYSEKVSSTPIEELREVMKNNFVSADAWHTCAKELKSELDKRYGGR